MTKRTHVGTQIRYALNTVWQDLSQRKLGTFLTVLVIAVSLSIPTITYLLWKNVHLATTQFQPESAITVYLHKNLNEDDAALVVDKIRKQAGIESVHYLSRQESLKEFKQWSGFTDELAILDDNPLPAVVNIKPTDEFNTAEKRTELSNTLNAIKGVQEVRLDNDWLEKLTALSWLFARVGIFFALLMTLAVFLVIGNSIRSDVYSSRANIDVMKLLGATDQFILRPFIYTGMIYALLGGFVAAILSSFSVAYFASAVKYVTDIFAVTFDIHGLDLVELLFMLIICLVMGYTAAWLTGTRHIAMVDKKR